MKVASSPLLWKLRKIPQFLSINVPNTAEISVFAETSFSFQMTGIVRKAIKKLGILIER